MKGELRRLHFVFQFVSLLFPTIPTIFWFCFYLLAYVFQDQMMPKSLFFKAFSLSWDSLIFSLQSYHASRSTTMDSSQLCTCPAVSLPGRWRHCLLIMKQAAHFLRRILADTVTKTENSGCAGMCFANVNDLLFQLIDGADQRICILHFLRDAGIWKATFQWKRNQIKYNTWKHFFVSIQFDSVLLDRTFT